MKYSPAFKWSLAVLLPLTIGWKLMVNQENPLELQDAIVDWLSAHRFVVATSEQNIERMPVIEASLDGCRLRIARVSPLGHQADLIRRMGGVGDHVFFVFRGAVYAEQPVRLTTAGYLEFRILRELGLTTRIPSVLAVISSCTRDDLPWAELGS